MMPTRDDLGVVRSREQRAHQYQHSSTDLQAFLGVGVTSFDAGNIILGGDGSDILEGRGGDDLLDGDRSLNVRISVRANIEWPERPNSSVSTACKISCQTCWRGRLTPANSSSCVRLLTAPGPDFDTAVFSGRARRTTLSISTPT